MNSQEIAKKKLEMCQWDVNLENPQTPDEILAYQNFHFSEDSPEKYVAYSPRLDHIEKEELDALIQNKPVESPTEATAAVTIPSEAPLKKKASMAAIFGKISELVTLIEESLQI
jgi:hypothetical protein